MNIPRVSLLHATHLADARAVETRERWLALAADVSAIEHIFSLDEDDDSSMVATQGFHRVVNPPRRGAVTAVRNWNAAAANARGALLFVIADDLTPPEHWDRILREIVNDLDPVRFPFAVKVREDDPGAPVHQTLMRHPVISRDFYRRLGLFDPQYRGVYCDDDLTMRAFSRAVVIDGTRLKLHHRHYTVDRALTASASQTKMNAPTEYEFGRQLFLAKWGRLQRGTNPAAFFPVTSTGVPTREAAVWRGRQRCQAAARSVVRWTKRHLRRDTP